MSFSRAVAASQYDFCPYFDLRQKPRPVHDKEGLNQEKEEGAGDMKGAPLCHHEENKEPGGDDSDEMLA